MSRSRLLWLASLTLTLTLALALTACPEKAGDPKIPKPGTIMPAMTGEQPPMVSKVDPPNFAKDLPAGERVLTVKFDRPLNKETWSWVKESPETSPEVIGRPSFDADGSGASLKVKLEPGRMYVVWLNNATMKGFADLEGVPLLPFRWTFSTEGFKDTAMAPPTAMPAALPADAPKVVKVVPADGATDVDPATAQLSVTFDRPMNLQGWSWVKEKNKAFPEGAGQPKFDAKGLTNTIPVKMQPGTSYVIWVNSETHRDFVDSRGVPAVPYRWSFTTAK